MQCKALFFALCLPLMVNAQNLVPNGSFEDFISCPDHLDGMEFVEHWYKSIIEPDVDYYLNPSPDYFHECALHPNIGVPENVAGNQLAPNGNAYCGAISYSSNNSNYREIIGVELSSSLVPGQSYFCSFLFSRAVGWSGNTGLAISRLGMKFSNSEVFTSTEQAIDGFVQLNVEEVAIDSINWVLLYGEVIPDQPYQYMHIGNFFSDEETEVMSFTETAVWAYYFIDDVRVSSDPLVITSVDTHEVGSDLTLFPNPTSDLLNIVSLKIMKNIRIYSVSGRLIEDIEIKSENQFRIDFSNLSNGLYIAIVQFENGNTKAVKINKN